jgi:hypothetical protein
MKPIGQKPWHVSMVKRQVDSDGNEIFYEEIEDCGDGETSTSSS